MKKTMLVLLLSLCASTSFAKQLTLACEENGSPDITEYVGATIGAVLQIANVNAEPVFDLFSVEGYPQNNVRIVQKSISAGPINLKIQFGKQFYNSVEINVQDCQDSFSASGKAAVEMYVGGFAGTSQTSLTCTCELK